jgi:mono/diheme cytochrome c family protein
MARCARCHEPDGNSATASEQAGRPVDLRSDEFQTEYTDLRIRYIMIHGEGKMQGVGGIRDAEVDSILRYVRALTPQGPGLLDSEVDSP